MARLTRCLWIHAIGLRGTAQGIEDNNSCSHGVASLQVSSLPGSEPVWLPGAYSPGASPQDSVPQIMTISGVWRTDGQPPRSATTERSLGEDSYWPSCDGVPGVVVLKFQWGLVVVMVVMVAWGHPRALIDWLSWEPESLRITWSWQVFLLGRLIQRLTLHFHMCHLRSIHKHADILYQSLRLFSSFVWCQIIFLFRLFL